jgi:alpha-mannosidase
MTFGIRPYDVAEEGAGLFAEAARWRSATASEIIMGFEPTIRDVPQGPPLTVEGQNVVVSALKVTHDRKAVALRLFNASPERSQAVVVVPQGRQVRLVGLDEQRVPETPRMSSEGRFSIDMNPWSLATVRIG